MNLCDQLSLGLFCRRDGKCSVLETSSHHSFLAAGQPACQFEKPSAQLQGSAGALGCGADKTMGCGGGAVGGQPSWWTRCGCLAHPAHDLFGDLRPSNEEVTHSRITVQGSPAYFSIASKRAAFLCGHFRSRPSPKPLWPEHDAPTDMSGLLKQLSNVHSPGLDLA